MTLSMAPLRFRKPSVLPFTVRQTLDLCLSSGSYSFVYVMVEKPKSTVTVSGYRQVWVCETCTLENDDQLQRCSACASVRSRYGQSSTRPTLAQKRGLVGLLAAASLASATDGLWCRSKARRQSCRVTNGNDANSRRRVVETQSIRVQSAVSRSARRNK